MNPKMTAFDATFLLGKNQAWLVNALQERMLSYTKINQQLYFGHETAKALFQFAFTPRVIAFHIVKGGTGKTSLAYEFAIRASLYGAKVLCVDMDQQGNLTQAFNIDAETLPVMIDVLVDDIPFKESIVSVVPGIDLIPSRFENAMLDEIVRVKHLPLQAVYRTPLQTLKSQYDVIIIDCPPSLGQSVAACALASDYLLSPVTPEKFALSGLEIAYQSVLELEEIFKIPIRFGVVLNKFESRTTLSQEAFRHLISDPRYQGKLLKNYIRSTQDFPNSIAINGSIFEGLKSTIAKEDIDLFTRELLEFSIPAVNNSRGALLESVMVRAPKYKQKSSLKYT